VRVAEHISLTASMPTRLMPPPTPPPGRVTLASCASRGTLSMPTRRGPATSASAPMGWSTPTSRSKGRASSRSVSGASPPPPRPRGSPSTRPRSRNSAAPSRRRRATPWWPATRT
jgi:hypothetical protein